MITTMAYRHLARAARHIDKSPRLADELLASGEIAFTTDDAPRITLGWPDAQGTVALHDRTATA